MNEVYQGKIMANVDQIKRLYKAIQRCTHEISLELLIRILQFPDSNSVQRLLLDLDLDNIQINLNTQTLVINEGIHAEIRQLLDVNRKNIEQIENTEKYSPQELDQIIQLKEILKLYKIILAYTFDVPLEFLVQQLKFEDIYALQQWLLNLNLKNMKINAVSKNLLVTKELIDEITQYSQEPESLSIEKVVESLQRIERLHISHKLDKDLQKIDKEQNTTILTVLLQPEDKSTIITTPIKEEDEFKSYQGTLLDKNEVNILFEFEIFLNSRIPKLERIDLNSFGFTEENKHITGLELCSRKIDFLPEIIKDLKMLKVLKIDNNDLIKLPDEITQLTNLQFLSIYKNKLVSLPEKIGNLINLRELSIYENELTIIPKSIGQLTSLKLLDLRWNKLRSLPDELGQLNNLQELYLNKNQLSSLPETIGNMTNMRTLSLQSNMLVNLPETISQLINLLFLDLENNQLRNLPTNLKNLKKLCYLDLRTNNLLGTKAQKFGDSLNTPQNRNIVELFLNSI